MARQAEHFEFLADGREVPREAFIDSLLERVADSRLPIIVYSSFEASTLGQVAKALLKRARAINGALGGRPEHPHRDIEAAAMALAAYRDAAGRNAPETPRARTRATCRITLGDPLDRTARSDAGRSISSESIATGIRIAGRRRGATGAL